MNTNSQNYKEYSDVVARYLELNDFVQDSLAIINEVAGGGKVYLIGGLVYRPVIQHLYGLPIKDVVDIDFLVESYPDQQLFSGLDILSGWGIGFTHLGNFKFTKDGYRIDCLPMNDRVDVDDINKINQMTPFEKMQSYLRQVPLSLQSIAYDIDTNTLYGDVCIKSMLSKKVWVNCHLQAKEYVEMYQMTFEEYMDKKYKDLGFEYVLD